MKLLILIITVISLSGPHSFATAQSRDIIKYKGEEYRLNTYPLESYFKKHPDKKPKSESMSTGLYRGYVATFIIRNQMMELEDIEILVYAEEDDRPSFKLQSVVSELLPLEIDWFTGILILPHGEVIDRDYITYVSTYENYILLEVKAGKIIEKREYTNKQFVAFKERQFSEYKKTDKYKISFNELKEDAWGKADIDDFIQRNFDRYTSEFLDKKNSNQSIEPIVTTPVD